MVEIRVNIATDMNDTGGFGLPQMSEREMFEKLLSSGCHAKVGRFQSSLDKYSVRLGDAEPFPTQNVRCAKVGMGP